MIISTVRYFKQYTCKYLQYRKLVQKLYIHTYTSRCICLYSPAQTRNKYRKSISSNEISGRKSAEELLKNSVTDVGDNLHASNNWSSPAYPKCERSERNQASKRLHPEVDPQSTSILLFPGQGSEYVGMGRLLEASQEAKHFCDIASDFLGYDLLELCLSGPKEKLHRTQFSQMAVFVLSYAAVELLKHEQPGVIRNCVATAGFSVGEITALVFAGAISYTEALGLVKIRAEAMQNVCNAVPGGMMTVFYGPDSKLEYACLCATQWCLERGVENPVCNIANYLFPHCKVIAGNIEALKFIEDNASEFKLKRIRKLPVSGAFHTTLMQPAAAEFKSALKSISIKSPKIPVYSNVSGTAYRNAKHILEQLPKQIYKPVKWEQTLHVLYERRQGEYFPNTYECGPGSSLKTCLKMVNAKAWEYCSNIPI